MIAFKSGLLVLAFVLLSIVACHPMNSYPGDPLSLEQLFKRYHLPANYNQALDGSHSVVTVQGFLDPANIFDRQNYPRFNYAKFVIHDSHGRRLEVLVQAADSESKATWAKIYNWANVSLDSESVE